MSELESDEVIVGRMDLGTCCACSEKRPDVRNLVCIPKQAPVPGTGWGCFVCHRPQNGAIAVLCDRCIEEAHEVIFVCIGMPALGGGRMPISELADGAFEHDMAFHPEAAQT